MQRYQFKSNAPRHKEADAQVYGEALEELRDDAGVILADDVWRAARAPEHVMHKEFQWDRDKAAQAHWRQRARALISMVLVVSNDEPANMPTRAYYNLAVRPGRRRDYMATENIIDDGVLRARMHEMALRELRSFSHRFHQLLAASQPLDAALSEAMGLLELAVDATVKRPSPRALTRPTRRG